MAGEGLMSLGRSLSGGGFLSTLRSLEDLSLQNARKQLMDIQLREAQRQEERAPQREQLQDIQLREAQRQEERAPQRERLQDIQIESAELGLTAAREQRQRLVAATQELQAYQNHPKYKTVTAKTDMSNTGKIKEATTIFEWHDNLLASLESKRSQLEEKGRRLSPKVWEAIENDLDKATPSSLEDAENALEALAGESTDEALEKQKLAEVTRRETVAASEHIASAREKVDQLQAATGDLTAQREIVKGLNSYERAHIRAIDPTILSTFYSALGESDTYTKKMVSQETKAGLEKYIGDISGNLRATVTDTGSGKSMHENISEAKANLANAEDYLKANAPSMAVEDQRRYRKDIDDIADEIAEAEKRGNDAMRKANRNSSINTILVGEEVLSSEGLEDLSAKRLGVILRTKRRVNKNLQALLPTEEAIDDYVEHVMNTKHILAPMLQADEITENAMAASIGDIRSKFGHGAGATFDAINISPSNVHGAPAISGPMDEALPKVTNLSGSKRIFDDGEGKRMLGFVSVDPITGTRNMTGLFVPLTRNAMTGKIEVGQPNFSRSTIDVTNEGNRINRESTQEIPPDSQISLGRDEAKALADDAAGFVSSKYDDVSSSLDDVLGKRVRTSATQAEFGMSNPMRIAEEILEPLREKRKIVENRIKLLKEKARQDGSTQEVFDLAELRRREIASLVAQADYIGNVYANSMGVSYERSKYGAFSVGPATRVEAIKPEVLSKIPLSGNVVK